MLTIQQIKDTVTDYFKDKPVKSVYLFGSYARGDAREDSDIDLLLELNTNKRLGMELINWGGVLEDKLNTKVDLVDEKVAYPRIRKNLEPDKILIYSICENVPEAPQPVKRVTPYRKDYIVYLELMQRGIEQILKFTENITEVEFLNTKVTNYACLMQFNTLGRNAEKLTEDIKQKFSHAEWLGITEVKDIFADDSEYSNWNRLWEIITGNFPELIFKIKQIIQTLEREQNGKIN